MENSHVYDSQKFYVQELASEPSSRTSSPAPEVVVQVQVRNGAHNDILEKTPQIILEPTPGVLPEDVYESAMAWWRAGIRKALIRSLKKESQWLASMQARVRTRWLDTYFVYTSSLGTHTFFMTLLPAIFFFGYDRTARGMVAVLGMGVYWTSFLKDLICSPRPFAPPVTRLTMGNHHLEYGFPSTHSTNSVSIALYIHTLIYRLYLSGSIYPTTLHFLQAAIGLYVFSIVYGRLYCGMHSFTDCVIGSIIGIAVWVSYWLIEDFLDRWLVTAGWSVPLTLISMTALMINQHPQPVDDCPCFEDSIAFISSILGTLLGKWHGTRFGLLKPYNPLDAEVWNDRTVWLAFAGLKLFSGVLTIFVWRLVAKAIFHAVLPPIFRFAAHIFTLPNRRFYTPATDYEHVPNLRGLHPIPSVIDLPNSNMLTEGPVVALPRFGGEGPKLRNGNGGGNGNANETKKLMEKTSGVEHTELERGGGRKHYDADVLTKVMVYVGIGMIASEWGPVAFELVGLGGV